MKFFDKKPLYVPTLKGWITLLILFGVAGFLFIYSLYPFLSPNQKVAASVLAVEGWVPDYAIKEALKEFQNGSYVLLITTGVTVEFGGFLSRYKNHADICRATLIQLGMDSLKIIALACDEVRKDRTYAMALEVKRYLEQHPLPDIAINLLSLGPHARRSRLLYRKALGASFDVGIISMDDNSYDKKRWWASSAGFRTVTGELLAYGYARIFFWP